jgi:hypothetical protein
VTDDDFRRLESKVDKLTDAVGKLILFEERQATQGARIGAVEAQLGIHEAMLHRTDRKIDQWVNRGMGVWAAAAVVFSLVQFWKK